ncbi:MAG: response regulator transcription factor [Bacteroidales bacterium]
MNSKSVRILLIEPSAVIVAGLQSIISRVPQLNVVGVLSDLNRLTERVAPLHPDLVIINPTLAEFHKRNQIKSLFPQTILIALLYNCFDQDVIQQFQGVIHVYDDPRKILHTLQTAVAEPQSDEVTQDGGDISEREKEILVAVAKGMMNKEIAAQFNLSIHTVISHRKNISRKTGIRSVSGFVVYALLNNLIEEQDIH